MIIIVSNYLLLLIIFLCISFTRASPIHKEDEFKVTTLPGFEKLIEKPIMFAGHLEIDHEKDMNYFFWKFEKPDSRNQNRTIFWLNGGPGCSSMDGALMEVGPLRINDDIEVEYNNGSWYELGDLVFVDQPGGTGFSYTSSYDKELNEVADNFLLFLDKFFAIFPELQQHEIYIAGESYAGQYIPYIAKLMLDKNYNINGLLIGNGWISPNEQSLSYLPFLMNAGIITKQDKFLPDLLKKHEQCQNAISGGEKKLISKCENILNHILSYTRKMDLPENEQCLNMYDYSLSDSYPSCGMNWPPLLPNVNKFLRDEAVMKLLNLKKFKQWNECDSSVSRYLKLEHSQEAVELLPNLLSKVPILLFNGDRDIICNSLGTEMMIANLEWAGSTGFSLDIETTPWFYDSMPAGDIKSQNNLTFINVYNASHMVPFDNSIVSRGLMDIMLDNMEPYENGISTPVYKIRDNSDNNDKSNNTTSTSPEYTMSSHSIAFYIFEIIVVIIILYGIHYFYKYYNDISNKPSSILRGKSKKSKKVHWIDEVNDGDDEQNNSSGTKIKEENAGVLDKYFWNKLGYNKIPTTDQTNHDIEMSGGEVEREFIIESDEEEESNNQQQDITTR